MALTSSFPARIRRLLSIATSPMLFIGLLLLFLGQRPFAGITGLNVICTWGGIGLVVLSMASRTLSFLAASGKSRSVELGLLLCQVGVAVALMGYWLTTESGIDMLGLTTRAEIEKFTTAATVLWVIVLAISLIPTLLVEMTIGMGGRHGAELDREHGGAVEIVRIREAVANGLTIALALSFLMVTCNIAKEKDVSKDVSYFKTSRPGTSTLAVAKSFDGKLRVMLFFPDVNEVANQVENYFDALNQDGARIEIQVYDRMRDSVLAEEYKATRDGTVILAVGSKEEKDGERVEKFTISDDIEKARRTELRELDKKVLGALNKLARKKRVAYLTVGHGELNDSDNNRENPIGVPDMTRASEIRNILRLLNYDIRDYTGLGQPIPEDATMVISLGPVTPFTPEEINAFDKYLARGGSMLIALDPIGEAKLDKLEGRLGVKFNPTPLANDKDNIPARNQITDRQFIVTNQFSSHASVTIAGRQGPRLGAPFFRAGSIEDAPFAAGVPEAKRTYTIRSTATTWADLNGDWQFSPDAKESRARYNLMAAIEVAGAEKAGKDPNANEGMRVVVLADAEVFSDLAITRGFALPPVLFADAVRWLGGEEEFAGDIVDEKDVRIAHTRNEDIVWFYATIVGAPVFILVLGLAFVYWRRKSIRSAS
jgi:hypothetical protein